MSEENIEIVRQLYRAMDARDRAAFAELADPDAEWVPDRRVGEGPVRGRDSIIQFFTDRAAAFDEISTDVEQLWESGDRVLVFVRVRGLGEASGAAFDIRIAHLWTVRDGVVVRGEGYGDREEALEAAGLSE
jgi:ketosteroid isomerase-like protein